MADPVQIAETSPLSAELAEIITRYLRADPLTLTAVIQAHEAGMIITLGANAALIDSYCDAMKGRLQRAAAKIRKGDGNG